MALEAAVEGGATSFEFADNLVLIAAVGRRFVRLTPLIKKRVTIWEAWSCNS